MFTLLLFVVACGAFTVGPLCAHFGAKSERLRAAVDGLAMTLVGGMCIGLALPHLLHELGLVALLLAGLGALLPIVFHSVKGPTRLAPGLAASGMLLHVLLDGCVIANGETSAALVAAVISHRLPVGFVIVVVAGGLFRHRAAPWAMVGLLTVATALGVVFGPMLFDVLPPTFFAGVEAFVVGLLLHVVIAPHHLVTSMQSAPACTHDHHGHDHDTHDHDTHDHHAHDHHAHDHHAHDHHAHDHHAHDHHAHDHHAHDHHAHDHHGHDHHGHDHHGHDHDTHDHHAHDHHAHDHHAHDHHAHDHHAHDQHAHDHAHDHHAHDHHGYDHHAHDDANIASALKPNAVAALGAIAGALFVIGFGKWTGGFSTEVLAFADTFLLLAVESAPALLLGYALAGVVPFLFSANRLRSLTKGSRIRQALSGITFGLPLPICSCGVLPLYESLIRRGVPSAAAIAFFVATPELGIDALLLSMPLLGVPLTIARLVAAFVVALLVALLLSRFRAEESQSERVTQSFRATPSENDESNRPWLDRVNEGLRFGFVEIFDHTMPWIAFGLVLAAMAEPLFSHHAIAQVPSWLQVPVAALVGVPLYVCASGATPIAAIAIHKGLSSGAVLAFLIAGPATNVTTFGVLTRLHGRRFAFGFGLCVTLLATAAGLVANAVGVESMGVLASHDSFAHMTPWRMGCALVLLAIAAASVFRQGPRGVLHQLLEPIHSH